MAKKKDATNEELKPLPVVKKSKPKKGVDIHQLDLFFTAYNPPVTENELGEVREGEPTHGIEKIISKEDVQPAAKTAKKENLPIKAEFKVAEKKVVSKKEEPKKSVAKAAKPEVKKATANKPAAKEKSTHKTTAKSKPTAKPAKKAKGK